MKLYCIVVLFFNSFSFFLFFSSRKSNAQPNDTPALLALATAARKTAPIAAVLVADSAAFVHKVKDVSMKTHLKGQSEATYESIEDMVRSIHGSVVSCCISL